MTFVSQLQIEIEEREIRREIERDRRQLQGESLN